MKKLVQHQKSYIARQTSDETKPGSMQLQSALSIKLPATSHQMGATLAKEQFGDATKLERFGNIFVLRHSVSLSKMLCF